MIRKRLHLALPALSLVIAACTVGPDYQRPTATVPVSYKENQGWMPASPQQAAAYENWWAIYNDPVLDELERKVDVSNQNLQVAEANYRAARAALGVQRAALFPQIGVNATSRTSGSGSGPTRTVYQASASGSWDADVWGRIRRSIESSQAVARASAADIAAARLSAQSELAIDYFLLRASDQQAQLLSTSIMDFQAALAIARNRYQSGIATLADVYEAQTQVDSAQAQLINTQLTRDRAEHAIAALIGTTAEQVSVTTAPLTTTVPVVPAGMPSALLERRPDIAAAEYQVASANAEIGVAVSAWFPDVTLTGSYGFAGTAIGSLLNASNAVWAFGPQLAETVFDAGARQAQVEAARARYDAAVAAYRQTVLAAFQQVEDQLASLRILEQQQAVNDQTVMDARQSEELALNQYRAGTADFTTVITAQTIRLNAENAALAVLNQRLAASVDLIVALGGGWDKARSMPEAQTAQNGVRPVSTP